MSGQNRLTLHHSLPMSARFKSRYVELAATVLLDFPRQLSFDDRLLRTFSIVRGVLAFCHVHLYFLYGVLFGGNTLSAPVICFRSLVISLMQSDVKLSTCPSLARFISPCGISVWHTEYNGKRADSRPRRRVAGRSKGCLTKCNHHV